MTRQELQSLNFTYDLFYLDFYCDCFESLTAAINRAKVTIKNNPDNKGGYNIRINNLIIAVY